jgi:hypothetical protein
MVYHQLGVGSDVVRLEIGVFGVHDGVRPAEQLLAIVFWHSEHVRDREQRQAHRDVVDEIAAALLPCRGDDFAGRGGELLLQSRDRPWREKP